jgi:hypothetical protein
VFSMSWKCIIILYLRRSCKPGFGVCYFGGNNIIVLYVLLTGSCVGLNLVDVFNGALILVEVKHRAGPGYSTKDVSLCVESRLLLEQEPQLSAEGRAGI